MSKDTRNVPALRFKGFSDAWEKRKLGELSNIRRGASPRPISSKKWFSETSSIGWLRISDVTEQNGRIYHVAQHLSKEGQEKTLVLTTKHLILSIAATVGKPVQNYIALGIHDGFIVFLNPKFDLDFMFYFLEDYQPKWSRFGQPGSQVNINSELVRELEINVPREDEQKKISHVLLNVDNLIAATQDKLDHFEEIKKALLKHLFDQSMRFKGYSDPWEKRKLGDLGSVAMNKRIYKDQTSDEGEIPFYKIGSFGKQADAFISRKLFNEYKKLYPFPKKGDILISASGSIGRTIVYNGEDAYFQDSNIIWIQHDNRLDNTFLHQLFNIIRWSGVEGTTIKRLYNKNILSTQILLPSVEEQRSIGSLLDNVDNLIAATQSKLSSLESLKKALLQGLFI